MPQAPTGEYDFPNLATPEGSSAYYIVRFSPPGLHNRQATLFAWHRELTRLLLMEEQHIALAKLDWWQLQVSTGIEQSKHPLCIVMSERLEQGLWHPGHPFGAALRL